MDRTETWELDRMVVEEVTVTEGATVLVVTKAAEAVEIALVETVMANSEATGSSKEAATSDQEHNNKVNECNQEGKDNSRGSWEAVSTAKSQTTCGETADHYKEIRNTDPHPETGNQTA